LSRGEDSDEDAEDVDLKKKKKKQDVLRGKSPVALFHEKKRRGSKGAFWAKEDDSRFV